MSVRDGYKMTEVGLIPAEWEIKDFFSCFNKVLDFRGKTPLKIGMDWGGTIPALSANNVKMGKIDLRCPTYYGSEDLYSKWMNKGDLAKGDVVMTMEAPLGNVAQIPDDKKYILSQRVIALKSKAYMNNNYLKYYLMYERFQEELDKHATGTTAKGINQTNLSKLKIIIPTMSEQQHIAEILSSNDALITKTDELIEKTKEVKQGLMQELLTKGIGHTEFKDSELGRIPKDWEVMTLEEMMGKGFIVAHQDGNHGQLYPRANEFTEQGIPYISATCIVSNRVDLNLAKYLPCEKAVKFKKGIAKDGDVLFAHNATVGPVAILNTDYEFVILSTSLTYYRCNKLCIETSYISQYMNSSLFVEQYTRIMGQSTRNQVPITTQRTLLFIVPAIEEQKELANIFNSINDKLEALTKRKQQLEEIKQGLMQDLLTGRVRVNLN